MKARFDDKFAPYYPPVSETKLTQTSLDCFDNRSDIQLRAELASKDKVICDLKEKISQIDNLNGELNRQLIESSFAHASKDNDISELRSELANLNKELKIKDICLVDYEGSKKRESQMVGKLAKQHMVILRLFQNLNSIRKRLLDMSKRTERPQYMVNAKTNPKDDEPGMLFKFCGLIKFCFYSFSVTLQLCPDMERVSVEDD